MGGMDITRAALADYDELYRLYRHAIALDNPKATIVSRRSFDAFETHPFPDQINDRSVARIGGEVVGMVTFEAPSEENTDRVFATIVVHPDHRRRGYGTALHEYAIAWAREHGRTIMGGTTIISIEGAPAAGERSREAPGVHSAEPGTAFVRQLGYQPALPEVARQLDVASVDTAQHDRLLADAWAVADGYRTVFWLGVPPDDLIEDVAYLDSRLITDAPTGELELEPEKITPERVRDRENAMSSRGRQTVHAGAIHEATGRLVAWTTICLDPEIGNGQALQFITLVDPDHRGHRLGTIVKIENLRYARTQDPKLSRITTWNAAANGYMIAINEALGFRPAYGQMEWQLPLL
jgi:GNAT superfamily N-acetyltransferase